MTAVKTITPRKLVVRGLTFLVALLFLWLVLIQIDWAQFGDLLKRLSWLSMIGAFLAYVAQNYFRALRYRALLDAPQIPLNVLFPISLYHNFLVRLLPFKLGELTYVVLLHSRLGYSYEAGVSSLFGSRLLELLIIVLVVALTLLLSGNIFPNQGVLVLVLVAGCVLGGVLGLYYSGRLLSLFVALINRLLPFDLVQRLTRPLLRLAEELKTLQEPRRFIDGFFWSFFTYGSTFLTNAILLNALGVVLPLDKFVVVISLGMFATAFPFNISGFGMVELSFAVGLTQLAGLNVSEATAVGLLLNGFQQMCAVISGVGGYGVLAWQARQQKDTP
jgi:uncharacterized protein (TIRG00374 family)